MAGARWKEPITDLLHEASQPLATLILNAPFIKEHVSDPAGHVMADDIEAAARRLTDLFARLRASIAAL